MKIIVRAAALLALLIIAPLACRGGLGVPASAGYGAKVSFAKGRTTAFPDFTLEYAGERRVFVKPFGRDFIYHDFKITASGKIQIVSWTTGTGVIDPADFKVGGVSFRLELRRSDKLGKRAENELVIHRD